MSNNAVERIQLALKLRAHNNVHDSMLNTRSTYSSHALSLVNADTKIVTST